MCLIVYISAHYQKEFAEVFQRQLETSLAASVAKYQGKL